MNQLKKQTLAAGLAVAFMLSSATAGAKEDKVAWWNKEWTQRQTLTINPSEFSGVAGEATLLLRVSDSSVFASARVDGGDLRFISSDGKTVLPHHVERYDDVLGEAFVWVKVPDIKNDKLFLYFGNPNAPAPGKAADTYGKELAAVYHFSEAGSAPVDATSNGNVAAAPALEADGAIIGSGARFTGVNTVTLNATESLAWSAGGSATISFWVKFATPQANAVLLSRGEGAQAFNILLDNGTPVVQSGNTRSATGNPIAANSWNHIVVIAEGASLKLLVNGEPYGTASAGLPALDGPIFLSAATSGFAGDIDELNFYNTALDAALVKIAFVNQSGTEAALKLLSAGATEGSEAGGGQRRQYFSQWQQRWCPSRRIRTQYQHGQPRSIMMVPTESD